MLMDMFVMVTIRQDTGSLSSNLRHMIDARMALLAAERKNGFVCTGVTKIMP